jgi:hypothetical protein
VAVGAATLVTLTVAGAAATAASPSPALRQTCLRVGAVLSDGPDSGADPIGYAEAQILPLRKIRTSDRPLQNAIDALSAAYKALYRASDRGASVKRGVAVASRDVDAICPGVAS